MPVLDEWKLTAERAAIHLPTRTVVVADLHLGYDRVRHRGGEAVPRHSLAMELQPLGRLLQREGLSRLVVAGDLFEDARCLREAMLEELRSWLDQASIDLVGIVPGNHDRGLSTSSLPLFVEGIELGSWLIVHGDRAAPNRPHVQGHEHPCLRWRGVVGSCFLVAAQRLVLPAYSDEAAGGNVLSSSRWNEHHAWVVVGDQVLDFGPVGELRKKLLDLVQ